MLSLSNGLPCYIFYWTCESNSIKALDLSSSTVKAIDYPHRHLRIISMDDEMETKENFMKYHNSQTDHYCGREQKLNKINVLFAYFTLQVALSHLQRKKNADLAERRWIYQFFSYLCPIKIFCWNLDLSYFISKSNKIFLICSWASSSNLSCRSVQLNELVLLWTWFYI